MSNLPLASIVVPSYNGAHKLPNLLNALEQQVFKAFEVIIVLDGSTDHSYELLSEWKSSFPLHIVRQQNQGRSVTRNVGVQHAQSDLIIFYDDDVRPEPHSVDLHLAHHEKFRSSLLVGSPPEDIRNQTTDFQQYRTHLSQKWLHMLPSYPEQLTSKNLLVTAANLSVRKKVFYQLNGFDVQLTDAEDFDFGVRAMEELIPVFFQKDNIAWHDEFATCFSYIRRLRQYQQAHEKLCLLKPELYTQKYAQHQPVLATGLKRLVYSLFGRSFWVKMADKGLLRIFPKKLRYKLYDIITYSLAVYFPQRSL